QYQKYHSSFQGIEFTAVGTIVEDMRMEKDSFEIERIRQAVNIGDKAFSHILGFIKPGIKELDLAAELEYFMRKEGASKPSFDTIVASGPRGALPHGSASNRVIEEGDLVTMDFGAI